ncbi:DNA repair protein RadC [Tepidicaulis marinus]|uniref:DNA repair protein RadC n=1 Tax=Tepidicaulis marinus TaxID=1333998 RepID=A0A081B8P3_9HYPH|nr:hypothetical protein [Tepidicaulis marinus]GAK44411.1 DNA repair protein RadC [Tepidicaulis marinus]
MRNQTTKFMQIVTGAALAGLLGAGAALAAEDTLKSYDRESMQRLFEQMSEGGAAGISEDDLLVTGTVKSDKKSDKKEDDKR